MSAIAVDLPSYKYDGETDVSVDPDDSFASRVPSRSGVGHRLRVTFDTLEYVVQNQANRREKLAILKGVSGFCCPGMYSYNAC